MIIRHTPIRVRPTVHRPFPRAFARLAGWLAFAALCQACAWQGGSKPSAPLNCEPRPTQAVYANVPGWAYYNCPDDALPVDAEQCARFREPTGDPERAATWACDRPGIGSVLLAAISEADAP